MKLESLTDLLLEELRDLYDAERQITEALPNLAATAFNPDLRDAFLQHLDQTKEQIGRLERIFAFFKQEPKAKHCHAMAGLIKEGQELLEQQRTADPEVLDAALIIAAQKVEHYEIAGYGSARSLCRILGAADVERSLSETLEEEAETDRILTVLAETMINLDAAETDQEIAREAESQGKR